jgi:hypothetical protein
VSITWVRRGRDFFSSADGRFDVLFAPAHGHWLALDADTGRIARGSKEQCVAWCEKSATEVARGSISREGKGH